MNYKIRTLMPNDIEKMSYMINKNFDGVYNYLPHDLLSFLNDKYQVFKGIVINKELIGFAAYTEANFTYNCYSLYLVNIHPKFQGKGYGQILINDIIKEIKNNNIIKDIYNEKDKLWIVLTCKNELTKFYNKFNFKICHTMGNKNLMLLEV